MFARRKEIQVTPLPDPIEASRENYARIRNRLADIDREIREIDDRAWSAVQGDAIDAAADAMLAGSEVAALSPSAAERRAGLIREREIATRALAKAKDAYHNLERRRQRAAARELVPQHRETVRDIYRALRALSEACDRERAIHDQIGGLAAGSLPRCGVGGIGSLTRHDSAASAWVSAVCRAGYADLIAEENAR